MAAYLDIPAANAALKEWYDGQKVEVLAYSKNPTMTMMQKETEATGKVIPIPVVYEVSQGRSSNFSNAQGNQTPMLLAEFFLTLKPDYSVATLTQQAMLASQDDKGGFLKFSKAFVDRAIQSCALSQASAMFRSGTGSIGQISSITNGVITLSNPADVSQFGVNMTLQGNQTDGGSPRAALGYVIGRNVTAGQITVSGTALQGSASTPSGWQAADFLLVQGDSNAKLSGFQAWLPTVAPSITDNFYGVNRSPDSRLFGLTYNGVGQPIEEALIDSSLLLQRENGSPDTFITNFGSESALLKALGTRKEFVDWESEDASISFRGVKVQGASGPIEVFADRNCQAQTGYMLQMNTWTLYSLNTVPHIIKYGDGLDMLRLANADASEVRVAAYSNLGCNAPGWNGAVALGS